MASNRSTRGVDALSVIVWMALAEVDQAHGRLKVRSSCVDAGRLPVEVVLAERPGLGIARSSGSAGMNCTPSRWPRSIRCRRRCCSEQIARRICLVCGRFSSTRTSDHLGSTAPRGDHRAASRYAAGSASNAAFFSAVTGPFRAGREKFGVLWNTVRSAASAAMSGIDWMPDDPVPMTATRLPVKSTPSCGHVVSRPAAEAIEPGRPASGGQAPGRHDVATRARRPGRSAPPAR
jgi:hypothetical protein